MAGVDLVTISRDLAKLREEGEKRSRLVTKSRKLRPISDSEIDDILSVILKPVCRVQSVRNEVYSEQISLLRVKLSNKMIIDDQILSVRVIDFLKKKLTMHCMKGSMTPGRPIGMDASDDLGASVMQGTLNSRHKAGSKQNAAGGLKAQREIVHLTTRSKPSVTLCFTRDVDETFESIMEYWRPLLVETKVKDLTYGSLAEIIIAERPAEDPWWYLAAKNIFDSNIPDSNHIMIIPIRLDVLYIQNLTLEDVRDAILVDGSGRFSVIYSPIEYSSDNMVKNPVIHIIPYSHSKIGAPKGTKGAKGKKAKENIDILTDPSLYIINQNINKILNTRISGLEGIIDLLPIYKKITDFIIGEQNITGKNGAPVVKLLLLEKDMNYFRITRGHIKALCEACGIVVMKDKDVELENEIKQEQNRNNYNPLSYPVYCKPYEYNLEDMISTELAPDERLPKYSIAKEEVDSWLVSLPNNEADITAYINIIKRLKLEYTVQNSSKGGKAQIRVNKLKNSLSINKVIELKIAADSQQELYYETKERQKRINGENVSILRTPTPIYNASRYYIAETAGGTMSQFIDIEGIDIDRSYSNNAKEIVSYIGVEGARTFIVKEIDEIWTNSGSRLQPLSIYMAADYMTYRGILTPFSQMGITSNNIGFMAKSTVHYATNNLQRAGVNNEVDPMNSAPSAIMTGKMINSGTGMVRLKHYQDYKPAEEYEYKLDGEERIYEDIPEGDGDLATKDMGTENDEYAD